MAYGVVIDACASATQWLQAICTKRCENVCCVLVACKAVALLDDLRSARWSPNVPSLTLVLVRGEAGKFRADQDVKRKEPNLARISLT